MKGRKKEAEVIVRLDYLEQKIHICVTSWPAMARKMLKLYGHPLPKSGDQTHYWQVPVRAITFRRLETLGKLRGGGGFVKKAHGAAQSGNLNVASGDK